MDKRSVLVRKAQEIGKQTAESVQTAAKTIGDTIKRAGNLNSDDVDQRLEALKNNRPKPKKTKPLINIDAGIAQG
ncbi:MAG: hypothetical protein R2883_03940 [Caldisericia bacterium]